MLDTTIHERRHAERLKDPEYRDAYKRRSREIAQTDKVLRTLDALRADLGMSKAELARRIDRNDASIRRLFTSHRTRPALPLIAAIADALGAELKVVPKQSRTGKTARKRRAEPARRVAA